MIYDDCDNEPHSRAGGNLCDTYSGSVRHSGPVFNVSNCHRAVLQEAVPWRRRRIMCN
jgi:hypothetical protein